MKLPLELVTYILSFVNNNEIKTLELPYEYYKQYLYVRLPQTKSPIWYRGVYNNINSKCFKCEKSIRFDLRIMVVCQKCEFSLDGFYYYPHLCVGCVNINDEIKRGRIFTTNCPSCNSIKMNLAIEAYS